jgi:hypothetical protein
MKEEALAESEKGRGKGEALVHRDFLLACATWQDGLLQS